MFRRARSIRQESELPFDRQAVPGLVPGLAGSASIASVSGLKSHIAAFSRNGAPSPGAEAQENGDSGEETGYPAQPSGEDGVPEDMATMVLNGPAVDAGLDSGPALRPGTAADPNMGVRERLDPASDAAIMLRVAEGDEASFYVPGAKIPPADDSFPLPDGEQPGHCRRVSPGSVLYASTLLRESYRAEARFTTWLYRIATNLAVNYARDTKNERTAQTVYLDSQTPRLVRLPIWPMTSLRRKSGCCAMSAWPRFACM